MVTSKLSPSSNNNNHNNNNNNSGQNNIDNTNLNNNNNNNNKTALTSHSNHLNNNTNHNNLNKSITNNHLTNLNPSNFTNNHKFNNLVNHNNNNNNNNHRHSPLNHSGTKHVQQPNLSMPHQDPTTSLMQQQQRHHLNRLSLGKIKLGLLTHQQTQHKQSHKRFMERASRLILHDEQKQLKHSHSHHRHMDMEGLEQYEELEEGEHKQPSKFRDENVNLTATTTTTTPEADYAAAAKASSSSLTLTKIIAAATSGRQATMPAKADEDDLDDEYDDDDDNDDENTQLLSDYSVGGGQQLINENDIRRIFAVSKSRGNFAALLVQQMYARHERIMSNVMGTRGKRQLSPSRMLVVKTLAFQMYPPPNEREEEMIWKKECVKAIDSKNRKVRINPGGGGGGVYAASTPKLDPSNPAFSQFLHLTSTPLSAGHLSRTTSASNTAALAAAVAAALSTKHQLLEQQQQQQQQHQQHQMHQTSPKQEPTSVQAKSIEPGGGEDMTTEGEAGAQTMETCPDLAASIPSNSSSSTTTNQNVFSDYSADR